MTLMARGMAFVGEKLATAAGVSVTYQRANVSATLTVVPGDQQAVAVRLGQVPQGSSSWMERDYLIDAADFAAAGFDGTPALGDRITETLAGESVTFELMRPSGGGQPWNWSEPERLTYRVHAKRV